MAGFAYPPPIFTSDKYNPDFFLSLDPSGGLSYALAQSLYVNLSDARLSYLSGLTPGTGAAGAVLVLDSSRNIGNINTLAVSSLSIGGVSITAAASEINYIDTTAGTAQASKALVLDASRNITNINSISVAAISIGGTPFNPSTLSGASVLTANTIIKTDSNNTFQVPVSSDNGVSNALRIGNYGTLYGSSSGETTFYNFSYPLTLFCDNSLINGYILKLRSDSVYGNQVLAARFSASDQAVYWGTESTHLMIGCNNTSAMANAGAIRISSTGQFSFNGGNTSGYDWDVNIANSRFRGNLALGNATSAGYILSMLSNDLSSGGYTQLVLGRTATAYNCVELRYVYSADSSSSNRLDVRNGGAALVSITMGGKLGIGTTTPAVPLHVAVGNSYTLASGGSTVYRKLMTDTVLGTGLGPLTYTLSAMFSNYVFTDALVYSSDQRLKKNFVALQQTDFDSFYSIQPYRFEWNAEMRQGVDLGFKAQDLLAEGYQALCACVPNPGLAGGEDEFLEPPDMSWAVDYSRISVVNVVAIKDLRERVSSLESINENLQSIIAELQAAVAELQGQP